MDFTFKFSTLEVTVSSRLHPPPTPCHLRREPNHKLKIHFEVLSRMEKKIDWKALIYCDYLKMLN